MRVSPWRESKDRREMEGRILSIRSVGREVRDVIMICFSFSMQFFTGPSRLLKGACGMHAYYQYCAVEYGETLIEDCQSDR